MYETTNNCGIFALNKQCWFYNNALYCFWIFIYDGYLLRCLRTAGFHFCRQAESAI